MAVAKLRLGTEFNDFENTWMASHHSSIVSKLTVLSLPRPARQDVTCLKSRVSFTNAALFQNQGHLRLSFPRSTITSVSIPKHIFL
jgi:hypothetical protein